MVLLKHKKYYFHYQYHFLKLTWSFEKYKRTDSHLPKFRPNPRSLLHYFELQWVWTYRLSMLIKHLFDHFVSGSNKYHLVPYWCRVRIQRQPKNLLQTKNEVLFQFHHSQAFSNEPLVMINLMIIVL